jgi:hypothetical protein
MSPFGELGPLDVQLRQRDEIFGRRSGLITRAAISDLKIHAFELFEHFMLEITDRGQGSISFKTAAEIAASFSGEVMGKIYGQINPDMLGQDFRDLTVATEYCTRLNRKFENIKVNQRDTDDTGIKRLVHQYPSHDFVIDFEEAKEIFQRVELPTATLRRVMKAKLIDMVVPHSTASIVVELFETSEYAETPNAPRAAERSAENGPTESSTNGGNSGGKGAPT